MSAKPIVLVIEGTPSEGETLAQVLDSPHYHTVFVESPEDAMAHVESPIDLVLCGVGPDEPRGRELLNRWKARRPEIPFVWLRDDDAAVRQTDDLGATGSISLSANGNDVSNQISQWLHHGSQEGQMHENGFVTNNVQSTASELRSDLATAIRIPPGTTLEDLERAAVEQALSQHHGNRTHAAKELGISVRTLQRKLKAWGEMRPNMGETLRPSREPSLRTDQPGRSWNGNPAAPRQTTYRPQFAKV